VTHNNTDTRLIERIRDGDSEAFRQLVERHKDVSLSLAFSILKDKALAEDALQEAFIKVFRKLHSFNSKAAFTTWLYRIVVNTSYNVLKQQKYHEDISTIPNNDFGISSDGPFNSLKEEAQRYYIQLAMASLASDEALVLRLFYLCELSIREVQEVTRFSNSKIKVCLHRGRKNMYQALQNLLGPESKQLL
jgi:RNA polymerase sigma-70 factor (ECF subfamily)